MAGYLPIRLSAPPPGPQLPGQLELTLSECMECSALVQNRYQHDQFHHQLETQVQTLRTELVTLVEGRAAQIPRLVEVIDRYFPPAVMQLASEKAAS